MPALRLDTALRQGRALRLGRPDAHLPMTVNMSLLQLPQSSFCVDLAGVLEAEGFPPSALWLELTESVLTDVAAIAVLADVRKLGVRVAIDDFGLDHSSLSYLRRPPVDVVKFHRTPHDIATDTPLPCCTRPHMALHVMA